MRMFLVILLLACSATGVMAANIQSFIGIFSDENGTSCDLVVDTNYVTHSIYVIASLNDTKVAGTTAVEFKIDNYGILSTLGIVSPTWNSPLVIGAPDTGIAIAYSTPQPPQLVLVGTISLFVNYAGDPSEVIDAVIAIVETDPAEGQPAGRPVSITDEGFNVHEVPGGSLTINCSGTCLCNPTTAVGESNWGSIKALY